MAILAGQKVRASDLNAQGVLKARGRRTTNSGSSTGSTVALLRLDDVPVIAGRAYEISAMGGLFPVSVNDARGDITVRFTTTGATPTTSSPILLLTGLQMFTAQFVERYHAELLYVPSTNQTLSLLLCFASVSGGAAVQSYGAATWPTELVITDKGADVGNTGTSL